MASACVVVIDQDHTSCCRRQNGSERLDVRQRITLLSLQIRVDLIRGPRVRNAWPVANSALWRHGNARWRLVFVGGENIDELRVVREVGGRQGQFPTVGAESLVGSANFGVVAPDDKSAAMDKPCPTIGSKVNADFSWSICQSQDLRDRHWQSGAIGFNEVVLRFLEDVGRLQQGLVMAARVKK